MNQIEAYLSSKPDVQAMVATAVINLERSGDRRALMQEQFAHSGVLAEFFPAFDACAEENAKELASLTDYGPWGAYYPHDKACTLSHIKALTSFLESDQEFCLVMEDDAYLSEDLGNWIADMSWWPVDADIVKLERWRDDRFLVLLDQKRASHLGRDLRKLHSRHSGTAGYIISRKGAEKVVAYGLPNFPADHLLFNVNASPLARALTTYQVSPALVVQGNDPKNNTPQPPRLRHTLPENKTFREIRRGLFELKVLPKFLWLLATGTARFCKVAWQDTVHPEPVSQVGKAAAPNHREMD